MTPLSDLFAAANDREKLLKKDKRSKWLAQSRKIINEKKRLKERQRKVKLAGF